MIILMIYAWLSFIYVRIQHIHCSSLLILSTLFDANQFTLLCEVTMMINIPYGQSSAKLPVIRSSGQSFIQSFSHPVIQSSRHSVIPSLVIPSSGHLIIWSSSHLVIWSFGQPVLLSSGHLVIPSSGHPVIRSYGHPVIRLSCQTN